MLLTDLQPLEKWIELEKAIHARSGLDASVFNTDGIRITGHKKWANRLCPVIKANPKGQTFICSTAHQNVAAMAEKAKKPVIEECDAGLVKIVVPIFVEDQFIGAVGGCGLLLGDEGEIETFLLGKTLDMDESELEELAEGLGSLSMPQAEEISAYIAGQIEQIVSNVPEISN
jgi:ligand-binding sensor protein